MIDSTRSQASAWERTLWRLCFPDPAFDRPTSSVLGTDVFGLRVPDIVRTDQVSGVIALLACTEDILDLGRAVALRPGCEES